MQRESSKEFQRGVGRARALMRQCFGVWPGAPLPSTDGSIQWCSWPAGTSECRWTAVDGTQVRVLEQGISRLIHHHRPHLDRILPDADDWLRRASNCLDLLKAFLYKSPSHRIDWSATIDRVSIPARWKQKVIDLGREWPKLQPLLWQLTFFELTAQAPCSFDYLSWLQTHAQSLSDSMNRSDGVEVAILLTRVGPNYDSRWLKTVFEFLNNPLLGQTPFQDSFTHADNLAQTLRDCLRDKLRNRPERSEAPSLADKFIEHLKTCVTLKPTEVSKVTRLLGAVVRDQLSQLVSTLNSRAHAEEKRLTKELLKVEQLGVFSYVESCGMQVAQSRAHVVTNLRVEGRSLLSLFNVVEWLAHHPDVAKQLQPVSEFFDYALQQRIANRIHLADEWQKEGWLAINRLLPSINDLLANRGVHSQLNRHWLRRNWPSIAEQNVQMELLVTGVRYASGVGWQRAVKLLESLVYDRDECLSEEAVSAIVKVAEAVPSVELALRLYQKLSLDSLARSNLNSIREAAWITQDIDEFRMALTWFNLHSTVAAQSNGIRGAIKKAEYLDLLRRLLINRDEAAIQRWSESIELLESFGVAMPAPPINSASMAWIDSYPPAFQSVLRRLANACNGAEEIAQHALGSLYKSADQVKEEIASLTEFLSNSRGIQDRSPNRLARIAKRIENLEHQLVKPHVPSPARQTRLIEKLNDRIDREMLEHVTMYARETLYTQLGFINVAGLCKRLQETPYDRILPALMKLRSAEQQLAWRALGSCWDNSLKLLSEPPNQKFLKLMSDKGLVIEAWLSSELSLEGRRADGIPYRVAFTQDPLDILLMGHHFHTCLALDGVNFFSTVSNLVDANKRVVYGRTGDGQIVGRCLFALTNQGQLQTFTRFERNPADGFAQLVDQFAEKLAVSLRTTQTQTGQVSCLVSRAWYDDVCMPVPSGMQDKANCLLELITHNLEVDPWQLAMQVFETEDQIIREIKTIYECGLFYDVQTMKYWLPHLAHERQIPLSLRLRMAARVWHGGNPELARTVLEGLTDREIFRSLGRETLRDLIEEHGFAELLVERGPFLARRLLRRSRPNSIRSDEQEESEMRRHLRDRITSAIECRRACS